MASFACPACPDLCTEVRVLRFVFGTFHAAFCVLSFSCTILRAEPAARGFAGQICVLDFVRLVLRALRRKDRQASLSMQISVSNGWHAMFSMQGSTREVQHAMLSVQSATRATQH